MSGAIKELEESSLKLLSQEDVLKIWPITKSYLSRLTNHKNENKRIPAYKYGKRKLYSPQELMWYREQHRYTPKSRSKGKAS